MNQTKKRIFYATKSDKIHKDLSRDLIWLNVNYKTRDDRVLEIYSKEILIATLKIYENIEND